MFIKINGFDASSNTTFDIQRPITDIISFCFIQLIFSDQILKSIRFRFSFEAIAAGLAFAILIFYGLAVIALFKMRKAGIGGTDVFRVPLYPFLPLLLLVLIMGLIAARAVFEWQNSLIDMGPGWAQASMTPSRMYKGFTAEGGIRAPLLVKLPGKMANAGSINHSFLHIRDIMPTVLDAADVQQPVACCIACCE